MLLASVCRIHAMESYTCCFVVVELRTVHSSYECPFVRGECDRKGFVALFSLVGNIFFAYAVIHI